MGNTMWVAQVEDEAPQPFATWLATMDNKLNPVDRRWYEMVERECPPETYPHLSMNHIRNNKWEMDHLPIFLDESLRDRPYNWARGKEETGSAVMNGVPYDNDVRSPERDVVINYRINSRDLYRERLRVFSGSFDDVLKVVDSQVLDGPFGDAGIRMLKKDLARRSSGTFDININVDCLIHSGLHRKPDMYKVIWKAIDAEIESAYTDSPDADEPGAKVRTARTILEKIAEDETTKGSTYKKFNDPKSRLMMLPVQLGRNAQALRADIENVYQRAVFRRTEFHKMSEPVVLEDATTRHGHGHRHTFRVHFTDPEGRYVYKDIEKIPVKSKNWYQSLWKRLLQPILKDAVIMELKDTGLRNIVLAYADDPTVDSLAYVTNNGRDMIIHCDDVDKNHAYTDYIIRHEYEHTVDRVTAKRTRALYAQLEDETDVRTLYKSTLKDNLDSIDRAHNALKHLRAESKRLSSEGRATLADVFDMEVKVMKARMRANELKASRGKWVEAMEAVNLEVGTGTMNNDRCKGFVSGYARMNPAEAVAEQRYAMRDTTLRTALLRRMSLYREGDVRSDAARLKKFYDIARDEMKSVAPQLYKQWGQLYENVAPERWGLLPGTPATPRGKHIQILASRRLALDFLQSGYHVAVFGYADRSQRIPGKQTSTHQMISRCFLQSNLKDPLPGLPHLESVLHVLGNSRVLGASLARRVYETFSHFTPTGRPQNTMLKRAPNFERIVFERSPYDPALSFARFQRGKMGDERFLADFRQAFNAHYRGKGIMFPKLSMRMAGGRGLHVTPTSADIWPRDPNLYLSTVFNGWYVNNRETWDAIDIEELSVRCKNI
eukprot:GEMP01007128.1.p1 GENE.GEMP01007128.1~~GEMP01007128.1.p1  ORF type:complete len:834 (+),score=147.39 GEMP01007128.1:345-2846(+)